LDDVADTVHNDSVKNHYDSSLVRITCGNTISCLGGLASAWSAAQLKSFRGGFNNDFCFSFIV
jgi:hypothetical protein